jgi:hypothetical protein
MQYITGQPRKPPKRKEKNPPVTHVIYYLSFYITQALAAANLRRVTMNSPSLDLDKLVANLGTDPLGSIYEIFISKNK